MKLLRFVVLAIMGLGLSSFALAMHEDFGQELSVQTEYSIPTVTVGRGLYSIGTQYQPKSMQEYRKYKDAEKEYIKAEREYSKYKYKIGGRRDWNQWPNWYQYYSNKNPYYPNASKSQE